jgi:hypothetical protein
MTTSNLLTVIVTATPKLRKKGPRKWCLRKKRPSKMGPRKW